MEEANVLLFLAGAFAGVCLTIALSLIQDLIDSKKRLSETIEKLRLELKQK